MQKCIFFGVLHRPGSDLFLLLLLFSTGKIRLNLTEEKCFFLKHKPFTSTEK